ncbi:MULTISPECIES: hypothetical protein [Bacillus]|uniref:hypothetical protein n=1 Tax=Bacillus TaxID=1386 RepID=UPI000C9FF47E|nr:MULTISPECIES: hypothetical protein [Bacillus]AUS14872.1 hypothetical protein C0W57_01040 [Bacillus velezensis]MBM7029887.1 hypothetical protein [Bacillus velezensis]MED5047671.1 hypothetical protein [Bacillus siamensis]MED5097078.1 hypothetical protein [Bacillus siamensis]URD63421.1 hypothetical protein M8X21_15615 [Bacillus velezensis]
MSARAIVNSALKPLGVPVVFLKYRGEDETYVRFFFYDEKSALNAEDAEEATGFYVQVDIYTKDPSEYARLETGVKKQLVDAGFGRLGQYDLYEHETEIYHKVLRFYYAQNTEEE